MPNRRRTVALLIAALLLLGGCFRLPETSSESQDTTSTGEANLRSLTDFESLGICTEDGWSGSLSNDSDVDLEAEIVVDFIGLGSEPLGSGRSTITVAAGASTDFEVTPRRPLADVAISCNIDLARLVPLTHDG